MEEIAGAGGSRREVLEIGRAAYTSFSDSFSDMSSSFSESSMYDAESSSSDIFVAWKMENAWKMTPCDADEFPSAWHFSKRAAANCQDSASVDNKCGVCRSAGPYCVTHTLPCS